MKHGFTLVEVMFANAMLLILVAGFAKITEQTFEQIQLKTLKNELASHLDEWTLAKLNNTLNTGNYMKIFLCQVRTPNCIGRSNK